MLRAFLVAAVGCLVPTWLWLTLVSLNNAWWPIGVPLAASTAAGLVLVFWPGLRRVGVGALLGTVLAAAADYVAIVLLTLYIGDALVT